MIYAELLSRKLLSRIGRRIGDNIHLQRIFTPIISQTAMIVKYMSKEEMVKEMLARYVDREELEKILKIAGDKIGDLLGTAYYVEKHYGHYGGPRLTLLEFEEDYEETGEKWVVIGLVLRDCGYEEWDMIERNVKEWMREQGFEELAGRVLVVCVRGFKEMLS
ncbi:MAG: hypothetical protein P3X22_001655 [Thermoprotei archaeon]|nr:hypothetical protein [Thermoprotei archaeon]